MNPRARAVAWLFVSLLVAACATAGGGNAPAPSSPPRVRCLSDGARDTASGTRPLFFLFCVESP
ncbi:MAG: hypothetical protein A3I17_07290 [Candidatus Rokubacteria bacterium RIFCSPLOWO2_02_FULL_72_37]|nr:MAG: hypothetical protein A3I17_07290 [Candidatus Rokubacteria bacterium RIFCSPLOWO2_02_FULL_72_37]